MYLRSSALYRYRLPFSPPLTIKGMTLRYREGLLLRLTGEDGSEGWGETAPLPGFSEGSLGEAAAQLRRLAEPMTGREATEEWVDPDGDFSRNLDRIDPAPSVRFGFELAVWNLYASTSGRELPELVTPHPRAVVPVNRLISGSPEEVLPEEVLEEVRRMRDAGYRSIKLKVGERAVAEDIALVRALGEEIGDGLSLRLDANRAWDYREAAGFVRGVSGTRFEYVEEPLTDTARLPELVREFGVPVALDESLVGIGLEELEEHRYARAFVIKPMMIGGISRTLRVAERALGLGVTPVVSSAYESGVGTAALVALAAGIGDRAIPAGLDTYRRLAGDVLRTNLDLPAPSVGVRETAEASRTVDVRRLKAL